MTDAPHNLKLEPPEPEQPQQRRLWPPSWPVASFALFIVTLAALDTFVALRRKTYEEETAQLRESMSGLERQRADQIVSQEHNKLRLALALLRRQAKLERALHLSVSVDSSAMYLERDGALLREMPVAVGPETRVGIAPDTVHLAPPLGVRRVARVLADTDSWQVPAWVYVDRGLPVPADRSVVGGLGPAAVLLDGGAIIYTLPTSGPLADSAYVLPGAVRARTEDLRAVVANLTPGMRIYFY
ncbi:MAG TPA: hypothetical protein VF483_13265 [Gemmatimonadaceae bacterium]